MYSGSCDTLLQFSVAIILVLVDGISAIVVERNEDNKAYINSSAGVLPHHISAFYPTTSPSIYSATRSVLNAPSTLIILKISGTSTIPCVTHTSVNLN